MAHLSLGERSVEESVRSIDEREPWVEFKWVGVPGWLRSVRLLFEARR